MLRNLLTALVAVLIIGVAGAVYYATRDDASSGGTATVATPEPTGGTAAPTPPEAQAGNQPAIGADEHVLGKPDAPVTIIEYASMTCPHCAAFHNETMPRIKTEFIDKGLVRFVFRPFPLDGLALRASAVAQCAPPESYFGILDILFRTQREWSQAGDTVAALKQTFRTIGITEDVINRCIEDKAAFDAIIAAAKDASQKFEIESTPTFIVNGKKYSNAPFDDYEDEGAKKPGFGTIIRELLPKT